MSLIYLSGFMGCGKSTIGKALAKELQYEYIDMDKFIEKKLSMPVSEIFKIKGEPFFRETETQVLNEISGDKKVISTGGGALVSDENAEIAINKGIVIYLDTPFNICFNRISNDKNRPLANAKSEIELSELLNKRKISYEKNCTFSVRADDTIKNICAEIRKLLLNK